MRVSSWRGFRVVAERQTMALRDGGPDHPPLDIY
jgi:hypothetical protein